MTVDDNLTGLDELARIAGRRVHRRYSDAPVDPALLRLLCACALSAPSKSDLQQADILIADKPDQAAIADSSPISRSSAPRRRSWCSSPTAAGCRKSPGCAASRSPTIISISSSTPRSTPASCWRHSCAPPTRSGLGCCPISVIRDHSAKVSEMLKLPQRVIPVAGMCVGWPAEAGQISAAARAPEHGASRVDTTRRFARTNRRL